jgi:hypothetical protein
MKRPDFTRSGKFGAAREMPHVDSALPLIQNAPQHHEQEDNANG